MTRIEMQKYTFVFKLTSRKVAQEKLTEKLDVHGNYI